MRSVLIVSSNSEIFHTINKVLDDEYHVEMTHEGQNALKILRDQHHDLVFIDLDLLDQLAVGGDPRAAMESFDQIYPHVEVVIITPPDVVTAIDPYRAIEKIVIPSETRFQATTGKTAIDPGEIGIRLGGIVNPKPGNSKGQNIRRQQNLLRDITAYITHYFFPLIFPGRHIRILQLTGYLG